LLERGEDAIASLEQDDADRRRRQLRILGRYDETNELTERARVLDAGRPGTDDAEREQSIAQAWPRSFNSSACRATVVLP
jgi:hypothetical protein